MAMARMHNKEVIMITVLLVKATLDRDGSFPFSKPSTFPLYPHLASLLSCCLVLFFFFSLLLEQVPCSCLITVLYIGQISTVTPASTHTRCPEQTTFSLIIFADESH